MSDRRPEEPTPRQQEALEETDRIKQETERGIRLMADQDAQGQLRREEQNSMIDSLNKSASDDFEKAFQESHGSGLAEIDQQRKNALDEHQQQERKRLDKLIRENPQFPVKDQDETDTR